MKANRPVMLSPPRSQALLGNAPLAKLRLATRSCKHDPTFIPKARHPPSPHALKADRLAPYSPSSRRYFSNAFIAFSQLPKYSRIVFAHI